ncbi:MAG TPA: TolC family protein [Paludibacter sp.]|nr:TolC family protein [Paludibacter sp.]HOS45868.1 TolC family protein [Paludibacter sp.]HPM09222.1 TolC family protein [Paludibacter sp.]
MSNKLSIILLCLVMGFAVEAETYHLDLEKSIELAKSKSYSMMRLEQDLKIAEYNLKAATSRFKTHIDLNFVTPQYTETVRQYEDSTGISFYPIKQMNYQGNISVNQPLPTDGYFYARSGLSNYDDYFRDLRSTNLNTRLGFVQPLHAFYGYNTIRSSFKQAELAYERSQKQLKREELNLIYNVSNAFYNLLSVQKSTEFASMDLERQTEAQTISKNKYEAGLIREVDALQMEVDLAEAQNNYELALVNQGAAMNVFKEILGIELSDSVVLMSELKYDVVIVDSDQAVQLALENRLEIREQEIQIELNKLNLKQQRAAGMIRADLTAYYEKVGVSEQHVKTAFTESLKGSGKDFLNRPQNFGVGLSISIPLLDWGENRALVNAAKSRLKQNELQKTEVQRSIEREVRNLVADLNSSLKRLQLLEKNVVVAEKSFEITRQRYSDGDIDSQALALERNRLNNAYNSHLRSYISYQLMLAELMRKTFFDFQRNKLVE